MVTVRSGRAGGVGKQNKKVLKKEWIDRQPEDRNEARG